MAESIDTRQIFKLHEVAKSIQKTLSGRYGSSYWIKAEMNKLNYYQYSGHCYPDLIEKSDEKIVAQFRAVLWNIDYNRINAQFLKILHEPLKDGIKILFLANIHFDAVHGISLRILDIDAGYSLGDLEREKQQTIQKLNEEKIWDKNKQLLFPLLPKRLAIISADNSKGYADFLKIIDQNNYGYRFFHVLFPSLLQGEKAVGAIIAQLERIRKVKHHFDVVAIIRGGGGDAGLSCYNQYRLARQIALFPIPVLTGIGHATNETVAEMVAYSNGITPTGIAEQLIEKFHHYALPLQRAEETIVAKAGDMIRTERSRFSTEIKVFRGATMNLVRTNDTRLRHAAANVSSRSQFVFKHRKQSLYFAVEAMKSKWSAELKGHKAALRALEDNVRVMDPKNVLKRGYSISRIAGRTLRAAKEVKPGDVLITELYEGEITSTVNPLK